MILFVVVVVIAAVLLVRWLGPQQAAAGQAGRTPLDILKERFARGEIERQEFEERPRIPGE